MTSEFKDIEEKFVNLMKKRQIQLADLKEYYDKNSNKFYKEIIKITLDIDKVKTRQEVKERCEDFLSLINSIGKVIDLNNSIVSLFMCVKIFEEHKAYTVKNKDNKLLYVEKLFEDTTSIKFSKNEAFKRITLNQNNKSYSNKDKVEFYRMLYSETEGFQNIDFSNYLNIQMSKNLNKEKQMSNFNLSSITEKYNKMTYGSKVPINKVYKRCFIVSLNVKIEY